MKSRFDPTRALQWGFLVLLAICAAQVVWWILDEVTFTRAAHDRVEALYESEARAAIRMLDAGVPASEIQELLPGVIFSSGEERVTIDPQALQTLRLERTHRVRRLAWEGAFFLVVIVAGMAVLAQALHLDAQLRRRQQNFLAAVTHEFKSPLASLRLSAETLALRDPPLEGRQKLVARILDDVDRLDGMIGNMLDTSRLEEGRVHLKPERVRLGAAVRAVLEELGSRAQSVGIAIEESLDGEPEVQADPLAVRTVLRNLIDNAVKATASAGGGRIAVAVAGDGRWGRVTITDTGVGFDPEESSRLFEKFYRPGDEMRRQSHGSGLGLYIVRRFVELGKGTVTARSDGPGRGAVFTVRWPASTGGGSA